MIPPSSLLFRQVNPSWVRNGRISSQVFRPTSKDKKKLSACDGREITAKESYLHYTTRLGFASVGVVAVTAGECKQEQLPVVPDPQPEFSEHVIVDFSGERIHNERRWENQEADGWEVGDLDLAELRNTVVEAARVGRLHEPGSREPEDLLRGLGLGPETKERRLRLGLAILKAKNLASFTGHGRSARWKLLQKQFVNVLFRLQSDA